MFWEATSDFPQGDVGFASVVRLASNFNSYNELVETISQVHFGEGESSDVMDRRRRVEPSDQLSVFRTSIGNVLSWLEFLIVLILCTIKSFWKLEKTNESRTLAVKPNNWNQQDQILGCSLVETNKLRQKKGLKKLKKVFINYVSRFEKCPLVLESASDLSNVPPRSGSMQGCDCGLKQSCSLGGKNQRL